jgi:hypothetical protein
MPVEILAYARSWGGVIARDRAKLPGKDGTFSSGSVGIDRFTSELRLDAWAKAGIFLF